MRRISAVVAVLLAAAPLLATAQWQKNQNELEREAAAQLEPAPLVAQCWARPGPGGVAVLRLRFYADGEYRAAGTHWQDRVRAQLVELNGLLTPAFAVRLEADSFRRWERRPGAGTLSTLLDELAALDAGQDVDWVVGLVSPLPLVSQSFHDLGAARTPGRHLVLRAMSSIAELDQLSRLFPNLDRSQREKLYSRRKSHKERAIFLHEWAHTLGLGHTEKPSHIMIPGYSHLVSRFDEAECDRLATSLAKRPRPGRAAGSVADPTLPRLPPPGGLRPRLDR